MHGSKTLVSASPDDKSRDDIADLAHYAGAEFILELQNGRALVEVRFVLQEFPILTDN